MIVARGVWLNVAWTRKDAFFVDLSVWLDAPTTCDHLLHLLADAHRFFYLQFMTHVRNWSLLVSKRWRGVVFHVDVGDRLESLVLQLQSLVHLLFHEVRALDVAFCHFVTDGFWASDCFVWFALSLLDRRHLLSVLCGARLDELTQLLLLFLEQALQLHWGWHEVYFLLYILVSIRLI